MSLSVYFQRLCSKLRADCTNSCDLSNLICSKVDMTHWWGGASHWNATRLYSVGCKKCRYTVEVIQFSHKVDLKGRLCSTFSNTFFLDFFCVSFKNNHQRLHILTSKLTILWFFFFFFVMEKGAAKAWKLRFQAGAKMTVVMIILVYRFVC